MYRFNEFHLESHHKTAVNILNQEQLHIEHRKPPPLQLHGMRQFPPRRQRPSVYNSRPHLLRSPLEPALRPGAPETPAVHVIGRHIVHR